MIDIHAHYLPGFYREALVRHGLSQPDGFPHIPDWSAQEHVAVMDRLGIATSLLSVSSPGVHLADGAETRELARAVNEEGRRAVVDHPERFGLFASLPLPDVDAAMAEIEFCCGQLDPCRGRSGPQRHGCSAPRDRVHHPARGGDTADGRRPRQRVLETARRRSRRRRAPRPGAAPLRLTTLEQLHYGSDYPFTPEFVAAAASEQLAEAGDPSGSLIDVLRANTERLLPGLRSDPR